VHFLESAQTLAVRAPELAGPDRRRRWALMLGEAYVKLAEYEAARTHLHASLRLGGRPPPASRATLGADLVGQAATQAARRGRRRSPLARDPREREREELTSTAYFHLAEVSLFGHDLLGLVHSTLAALNHGERGGSVREMVFGMGGVSYTASMLGLRTVARGYRERSLELAERKGHLPTIAFAHQIAATVGNCIGDWEDVDRSCRRSAELFERLGDRFRWQSCQAIHGYMHLSRGDFAAARTTLAAAFASAHPDGAPQVRMWACAGALACSFACGTPTADEIVETERVLGAGVEPAEETLGLGALALAYERRGEYARALRAADRALAILRSHPPATSYTHWSIADIADVYLAAARRSPSERTLRTRAEEVGAVLRRASLAMPVIGPRSSIIAGRLAAQRGDARKAARCYADATSAARRLRMPYERALADVETAFLPGPQDTRRAASLEAAIHVLDALGAGYDASRARSLWPNER
jgi:tetratricopeptide (TPR) repeat protein